MLQEPLKPASPTDSVSCSFVRPSSWRAVLGEFPSDVGPAARIARLQPRVEDGELGQGFEGTWD